MDMTSVAPMSLGVKLINGPVDQPWGEELSVNYQRKGPSLRSAPASAH